MGQQSLLCFRQWWLRWVALTCSRLLALTCISARDKKQAAYCAMSIKHNLGSATFSSSHLGSQHGKLQRQAIFGNTSPLEQR